MKKGCPTGGGLFKFSKARKKFRAHNTTNTWSRGRAKMRGKGTISRRGQRQRGRGKAKDWANKQLARYGAKAGRMLLKNLKNIHSNQRKNAKRRAGRGYSVKRKYP